MPTVAVTGPVRILQLDDDPLSAALVITALEGTAPFTNDVSSSREEFLSLVTSHQYDVVLADYQLPGWTGMHALAELRALGIDTPLILVTAALGEEFAVECLKLGATDYVLKGNLVRLPAAIERAVDDHRKRVAVDESFERMRKLTETSFDGILVSQDGMLREVNAGMLRIFGFADDAEVLGRPALDFVAEESRVLATRALATGLEGTYEFVGRRKEGSRIILEATARRHVINGHPARIVAVRDVTERRMAERWLKESEERYRKLTEASFDAISVTQDGVIREVNPGFVRMFGFDSESDVVGLAVADVVASESWNDVAQRIAGDVEGTFDIVGQRRDGRRIFIEMTTRMYARDGRSARISALRDVTDRRALEAQFRQAQKMEAVGRLAGGVAHDFNNLLTVISAYTEMAIDGMEEGDVRRDDLIQVREAAGTAAKLTRQLLAFSRQQVVQPRVVSLADVVESTRRLLSPLVGEDVHVTTRIGATAPIVRMDVGQLEQILMNLAVNARDAMPDGGELTIETSVVKLESGQLDAKWPPAPGQYCVLSVSDTGFGMDAETRARIFEPFYTTKDAGKGTGLGLSTVYGIVNQNDGCIGVDSEPGAGTTFRIYLPLHVESADVGPDEIAAPGPRGSETILLVEDSAAVRDAVRRILQQHGYVVVEAPLPSEALRIAAASPGRIDLLLTDVVMPEMGGRVLAEQFIHLRPDAKVLFMSGYTDDAIVRHGVLSAEMPYLQKPFGPRRLASKVREVLDQHARASHD